MKFYFKGLSLTVVLFFCMLSASSQNSAFTANVQSGCFPLVVQFTDQSTGPVSEWEWSFGNGNSSSVQHPSAIYVSPGVYTVSLRVSHGGASDTETKTGYITVHDYPVVTFEVDNNFGCAPLEVSFTNTTNQSNGTITEWLWVFGDGGTSTTADALHTYLTPGQASVSLKATNEFGCESTKSVNAAVSVQGPTAKFSTDFVTLCQVPADITFYNQSTGDSDLTYTWDFGDGASSTEDNPEHSFQDPGVYNVELTATDESGCSDSFETLINAGSEGGVSFEPSATTVCVGDEISFAVQSEGTILTHQWNFGNGTGSLELLPVVSYTQPGTYKVTLDVFISGKTCHSIVHRTIQVVPLPSPTFTSLTDCDYAITLQNTTGNTNNLEWYINGAFFSTSPNVKYSHGSPGDVQVRLVVFNSLQCSNFIEKTVHIIAKPDAAFSPHLEQDCIEPSLSGCAPFALALKNETQSETSFTVQWVFGNGKTSTAKNPAITYIDSGSFKLKMKVTNTAGCVDWDSATVKVSKITPTAKFSIPKSTYCAREEVVFKDESTNANFWCWDFGDGTMGTGKDATHAYTQPGTYTVTLTAKNAGCKNTVVRTNLITVRDPYIDFTVNKDCANPFQIGLTDLSTNYDSLFWDFGDGTKVTGNSSSHLYAAFGNYEVKLRGVSNTTGCKVSVVVPVVIQNIVANFDVSTNTPCKGAAVDFTSTSDFAVAWEWSFGDGQYASSEDNQIAYSLPGVYDVTLRATNSDGCLDEHVASITVPDIVGDFSFTGVSDCQNLTIQFNDLSTASPPIESWDWQFGDGSTSTDRSPQHTYHGLGAYPITLTLTNEVGACTFIKEDAVVFTRPTPDFSLSKSNFCIGEVFTFSNSSKDGLYYAWDFGDGRTTSEMSPALSYDNTGAYAISLSVTDAFGCTKSVTKPSYVKVTKPVADFTAFQTSGDCPPLTTIFQNTSSSDATTFHWDFGDGQSSQFESPANAYTKAGIFDVRLIVVDQYNCSDIMVKEDIVQVGGPSGSFEAAVTSTCINGNVRLTAITENTQSFEWDFGDGNVVTTSNDFVDHQYKTLGSYTLSLLLKDAYGCEVVATGAPVIVVNDSAKVEVDFPFCVFEHDAVQLIGKANEEVSWEWSINGQTSLESAPIFTFDTAGVYHVNLKAINANGCQSLINGAIAVQGIIDFIPNVITPNGDGDNEVLEFSGLEKSEWDLRIYNRWGKSIYDSNRPYANDWNGKGLATGSYFMVLENLVCPEKKYKGYVTIIR